MGWQNHQRIQNIERAEKGKLAGQYDQYRTCIEHAWGSIYQGYFSSSKPEGFEASKKVAAQGGNVAKVAMKELEAKTGVKVVTALNAKSLLPESKATNKLVDKNPTK